MSEHLDNFFGFVEGFEDEEIQRKIFGRTLYAPAVPRVQHCNCPHCGKDVFACSDAAGLLELVTCFYADRDGRANVFETDVIPHECEESDFFDDVVPF